MRIHALTQNTALNAQQHITDNLTYMPLKDLQIRSYALSSYKHTVTAWLAVCRVLENMSSLTTLDVRITRDCCRWDRVDDLEILEPLTRIQTRLRVFTVDVNWNVNEMKHPKWKLQEPLPFRLNRHPECFSAP